MDIAEAKAEGETMGVAKTITAMLADGMPREKICEICKITESELATLLAIANTTQTS